VGAVQAGDGAVVNTNIARWAWIKLGVGLECGIRSKVVLYSCSAVDEEIDWGSEIKTIMPIPVESGGGAEKARGGGRRKRREGEEKGVRERCLTTSNSAGATIKF
jgi:hypothetical protein